jgi:multidrug efflux pump subunit AcrA (membrane-fusion protein)
MSRRPCPRWCGTVTFLVLGACTPAPPPLLAPADAGAQRWVPAQRPSRVSLLEAPARLLASPGSTAVTTPPLRARVVQVRVQAGDRVDAGAPLVDVLMPELLEAAGREVGAQARLSAWSDRYRQLEQLRLEGLARVPEVSEAAARMAEAGADLAAARAILRSASVQAWQVDGLLSGSGVLTLRAPLAGVVMEVTATPGQLRDPSQGPLVTVAGAGPTRVEARFSRPPEAGEWSFSWAGGSAPVHLVGEAPVADPRDGTFLAWLEGDGPLPAPAGTLGRVSKASAASGPALLVPAHAVRREGGSATVRTADGPVAVEVLECGTASCLVTGELVVGTPVSVESGR